MGECKARPDQIMHTCSVKYTSQCEIWPPLTSANPMLAHVQDLKTVAMPDGNNETGQFCEIPPQASMAAGEPGPCFWGRSPNGPPAARLRRAGCAATHRESEP